MDYYSKYLKYKSKYLELQRQIGGDDTNLDMLRKNKFNQFFINTNIEMLKTMKKSQIEKMIELKKTHKLDNDYNALYGSKDKESEKKLEDLKNNGFTEDFIYSVFLNLNDEQLKQLIQLKKSCKTEKEIYSQVTGIQI